ncbi:hypothetical protein VTN02DRAFT_3499 [Thermoascus thermophilus]
MNAQGAMERPDWRKTNSANLRNADARGRRGPEETPAAGHVTAQTPAREARRRVGGGSARARAHRESNAIPAFFLVARPAHVRVRPGRAFFSGVSLAAIR